MTSKKDNAYSHDTSFRGLLSHPEMVRDLIKDFVPDMGLHCVDYSTLEMVSGHFVTRNLRKRESDVIWRVKVDEEWLYLYIHIELQSKVDPYMAIRMMTYLGLLYQKLIKEKKTLSNGQLPPVLPIVLYNGSQRWNAPQNVADLIPKIPDFLSQFLPSMKYFLIEENIFKYDDLDKKHNLMAVVFQVERPKSLDDIDHLIQKFDELLPENRILLRETIVEWTHAVVQTYSNLKIVFPETKSLKELRMTLQQAFHNFYRDSHLKGIEQGVLQGIEKGKIEGKLEGIEQGIEQGMQRGQIEGEKIILRRQLTKRFGKLPLDISDRINQADAEQIETWSDAVLDAQSLYEIFENLH